MKIIAQFMNIIKNDIILGKLFFLAAILNSSVKNVLYVKLNDRNGIIAPKSTRNDLLFVIIASLITILYFSLNNGGHLEKQCFSGLSSQNREGHGSSF